MARVEFAREASAIRADMRSNWFLPRIELSENGSVPWWSPSVYYESELNSNFDPFRYSILSDSDQFKFDENRWPNAQWSGAISSYTISYRGEMEVSVRNIGSKLAYVDPLEYGDVDRLEIMLSADDNISGTDSGDYLIGHSANDVIQGFDGNDTINGGRNQDTLIGGLGDDVFLFNVKPASGTWDTISNFRSC